ncbi:hypothetical protein [Lysobacter gummosus]|uniref:hypothetical protein n=1 Tax=Lysobacter gummosus TaxID=262324 RepID=UPI003633E381
MMRPLASGAFRQLRPTHAHVPAVAARDRPSCRRRRPALHSTRARRGPRSTAVRPRSGPDAGMSNSSGSTPQCLGFTCCWPSPPSWWR